MSIDAQTDRLTEVLRTVWGYETFRPLQWEAMQAVLDDRDSLVVLPTGGGKSLCYQAPAVATGGLAVVVSPLISLMKDQVDGLQAAGVPAACVNSSLGYDERGRIADEVRAGRIRLLYMAPERLVQERTLAFLEAMNVSFFAIDEAHCISEWGHDFRPEYRQLAMLKDRFRDASVHGYTATATTRVREDIVRQLDLQQANVLVGSFHRPNLIYKAIHRRSRLEQVRQVIARHPNESGIVYCISRRETEEVAGGLEQSGVKARPYHAGMTANARKANQDAFIEERCDVIVATVAFGMGIDKSNVRFVVHCGPPKSLEAYQQESGRAGRDGLEAECILLFADGDVVRWRSMLADSDDAPPGALATLQAMHAYACTPECRHRALVRYFGQELPVDNCGACDVCLNEVALVDDPLTLGQKILSSVVRQEQRFGGEYTALVLKGSQDSRIIDNKHDQLSTYGLLAGEDKRSIRDWIEQLAGQQFLAKGEFGMLQVTEQGWQLLRGEVSPRLTKPRKKSAKTTVKVTAESWEGVDRELFDDLRQLRRELAEERGVPAYVVFGDASLRDMARKRPSNLAGFHQVHGVGEKKLSDFGEAFVERIVAWCSRTGLSLDQNVDAAAPPMHLEDWQPRGNALDAFPHFRDGKSVMEVARITGRKPSTVYGYLCDYIRSERITDHTPWVDSETARRIDRAAEECGTEKLRPIYDWLHEEVSYNDIRIVLACRENAEAADD